MAAEFAANSIATTIFEHSLGAIVRHVGYLWNHKKNLADLETHVNKLDNVRNDKSHSILVAQRNAERIRNQAESWQDDAEKIRLEARNIMELYEENAKKRCLIGLCPNVASHYQLSRKACKKQLEIVEALTEANQFNAVSDRAVRRAMSSVSIEGYLTFDSRESTLEEIMKTLKDATKNLIGVYGLGGMGKTTLAKQVASRAAEEKLFDEIVMAPVTQTPELKEIQGEIAKMLGLKLDELSVAERAGRIHERMKERKVLVILDDLWEKLDLEKVGIPSGLEHKGCKLLFTSRYQWVLSSMGTKKDFHLGALEEEEAWRLFEEKTADVVKDLAFLDIGKKVAKLCAGLPVLIVTVAASLSSRPSLPAWKDALKELRKMNNKEVQEIVNSALELISYKHLQKTHKRLFLLCGLHGSGFLISDLLKYSWGWNFFDEDVVTLEEARNKLHALILDLKASCLLLDGDDGDIIKIHDVVRSVAISLARKNQNMFYFGDCDTEQIRWPNDDVLRSCVAMIFDDCRDFSRLPQQLDCSLLEFFYLRRISLDASSTIPDTFFQKTRELKVLAMTKLCFSGLPSSLSFLENLQTLCLDHCTNLEDISVVGELKKLQVLSFMGSDIKELPRGIGHLSELRLLDLTDCSKLEIVPAGLLEGLSNLEELYMRKSFNKWEAEELHSSNRERKSNASLTELKHLPKLRSLEIEVEDAKLLSQDLNLERLDRFRIVAGDIWAGGIDKKGISRKLGMNLVTTGINHLQNGVKGLLKRTECLCLRELKGIKNVIGELDGDGLPDLKHLSIQTDYEIQFIINVELKQQKAFPALESLYLSYLSKLEKICNGRLMQYSFGKLTTVNVQNCDKMESLFSFSMVKGLPCLQELQVDDCSMLKGIVVKKSDDEDYNDAANEKIEFVQLRKLTLVCLPQLMSFYCSVKEKQKYMKAGAQSEEIVSEEEEQSSSMSFFKEVSFPSLEELTLSGIANLTEIWNHKLLEKSYRSLKSLVVKNCACLVNVFSFNLLQLSRNLEVLRINNCAKLEEVFVVPEEMDNDEHNGLVPQLVQLSLINLPKLICIWSNYHPSILSFKNLKILSVENCDNLKYLFTTSITMGLVQLQELRIRSCARMKKVVVKEDGETIDAVIFPQLSYLYLKNLPNLATFYSGDEEMASNEDIAMQPLFSEKVNFPSLESLIIHNLDNIKSIWHNQANEEDSCCKLEAVEVERCAKLLNIFPSALLNKIQSVKKVRIDDCQALEEIFEDQKWSNLTEITCDVTTVSNQLRDLYLNKLPKLKSVFPACVAQRLHQLEELLMWDCREVETIVEEENDHDDENKEVSLSPPTFTFPKLTTLYLSKLPKVECFYPKKHTLEWPMLKNLEVDDCHQISILDILHFSGKQQHNNFQKVLSKLKRVTIRGKDMKMMTRQHSELFLNLKEVTLTGFDGDESAAAFPSNFLYALHNLKELIIEKSSLGEIFPYEEGQEETFSFPSLLPLLPHLRWLVLRDLPELKYICTQNSPFFPILNQLTHLWLTECPRLTNLVPTPSLSFKFLMHFIVEDCGGLIYLMQPSTAASLEQLEWLRISGCPMMEEIVAADDSQQDDHHIILFTNLKYLKLIDLPRLTNFCTANNYTFNFPKLDYVQVCKCPNMRTFSPGITITPKLQGVSFEEDAELWKGDLNTTIQHHFSQMETPTTSEPQPQIHGKTTELAANEIEEINEEGQTSEPREEIRTCVDATKPSGKGKEKIQISEEDPNYQDQASSSSTSTMPFYGESSVSTEQQSEKSQETVPEDIVASSSLLSPPSNRPQTSPSLVTETGTSIAASNSQQWDFQGLRVRKEFIALLSEFLQIYQTQPLKSMSAQQVQFMVNAFRDLSSTNFSIEWFSPYVEKARERLSVVEREKEICELELKISEAEAHLQSLKDRKRTLEEKNEAFASSLDLDN